MNTIEEPTPSPADTNGSLPSPVSRLREAVSRQPALALVAVVLLVSGAVLLVLSLSSAAGQPLYPAMPTFTPVSSQVTGEVISVSFTDLGANPADYLNQEIQVTGRFTPLEPPPCLTPSGPDLRWSLVADDLQLKAMGFENILRLVAPGTELTVRGYWQYYQGPLGCGKEPPSGSVWFLRVNRIVEPNPLLPGVSSGLTVIAPGMPTLPPLEFEPTSTRFVTPTEFPTATEEPAEAPTEPVLVETPAEELTPTLFPTVTPRPDPNTTPGTPESPTPDDLTPGVSPTPSPTGTIDLTPPLPTNTPPGTGYPPATNTPTGGYP